MTTTRIDTTSPTARFWTSYAELWNDSRHPTAFQAPHFIRFLHDHVDGPVLSVTCHRDDVLIGACFFVKQGSAYQFLSDLKTDHNYFLFRKDVTEAEMEEFFRELVGTMKRNKWTFRLNNQPAWSGYREILLRVLRESSLFFREVRYNGCLIIDGSTPEALFKACDKQKLRQKMHRLEDMGNLVFEVYRGDEELDAWLEEFYDTHVKRWADTNTPSHLDSPIRREFFSNCVRNWIKDGILVRFSLKLDTKRIGFVVALIEDGSLVHHSTTYDIDFTKQSPGLIIIRLIAKWTAEQKMTRMEFGDGDEAYKYMFAKGELPMHRLFISHQQNIPFIMKARMINTVWGNQAVHRYYFEKVRPLLLRSEFIRRRIS